MTLLICKAERLKDCKWAEWKWSASAQVSVGIGLLKSFYFSMKIYNKAYTKMIWESKSTNGHLQTFFFSTVLNVLMVERRDSIINDLCPASVYAVLEYSSNSYLSMINSSTLLILL
mgnify:CR=1 FL=1